PVRTLVDLIHANAPSALVPSTLIWRALLQLLATLFPIVQPLANASLETAVAGLVEGLAFHSFRPVILSRKGLVGIVVVGIAFAVADGLHQPGRRIEDMHRRHQRAGFLGGSPGPLLGHVGG